MAELTTLPAKAWEILLRELPSEFLAVTATSIVRSNDMEYFSTLLALFSGSYPKQQSLVTEKGDGHAGETSQKK